MQRPYVRHWSGARVPERLAYRLSHGRDGVPQGEGLEGPGRALMSTNVLAMPLVPWREQKETPRPAWKVDQRECQLDKLQPAVAI
jgi:hypothetical protein